MKTKQFRLVLIIGLLFLFASGELFAQTGRSTNGLIYMRIVETTNKSESRIIISDGREIIKIIDLSNYAYKNYESNIITISNAIDQYISAGYELISSASIGTVSAAESTYIFKKMNN